MRISLPREASPITQNAFSLVLFYDYHQRYLREQQRVLNMPHGVSESEVHELLPWALPCDYRNLL